jgi:ribonuclease P protein component
MPPEAAAESPSFDMLRGSPEIKRVLASGRRTTGSRVVLYVVPEGSSLRAGFACPRSIGGAVVRNRARRLMKEAWRASASRVREGYEVMIVARPEIRGAKLAEVAADLELVLAAAGVLR